MDTLPHLRDSQAKGVLMATGLSLELRKIQGGTAHVYLLPGQHSAKVRKPAGLSHRQYRKWKHQQRQLRAQGLHGLATVLGLPDSQPRPVGGA